MRPLIIALLLSGCGEPVLEDEQKAMIAARYANPSDSVRGVHVFTDPLTGCEYLTIHDKGLTPRLSSAGYPICRDQRNERN